MIRVLRLLVKSSSPSHRASRLVTKVTNAQDKYGFVCGYLLGRFYQSQLRRRYSIFVSMQSEVGENLQLPHPVGVTIGEGAKIGKNVTLYQHVTIGRRSRHAPSYPIVEDNCVLYPGAIAIGEITIGNGSRIGANCVVSSSVPSKTTIQHFDAATSLKKVHQESFNNVDIIECDQQ